MTSDTYGFKLWCTRESPWGQDIAVRFGVEVGHDQFRCAQPIVLADYQKGSIVEPMMVLTMNEAQTFMDELWNCGLRPTEGTGSAGSMAATQKHLEDMRQLAFSALKVTKP